jgi:hypothetical protein
VADRKPFLLRIDATVLEALQRWANDDLRSLNGQIDFLLRRALRASGRLPNTVEPSETANGRGTSGPAGPGARGGEP